MRKRALLSVGCMLVITIPLHAQTNAPQRAEVQEYRSLGEIFRKLPSELHPHKELWKTNPLLQKKLDAWFNENAVGHRITLKQREIVSMENVSILTVADPSFYLGGVLYKTMDGIPCDWRARVNSFKQQYTKTQKEGKAPAVLPYADYRKKQEQQEQKNAQTEAFLATLRLPEKKNGRVVRPGSKVNITGTISSICTKPNMYKKPPQVLIFVNLVDVEVTK